MAFVDAAILWVARVLAALGAAAVAGIFALVLAAVVMRYGAGAPFRFTEELSGLLLVSSVFLVLPLTVAGHHNIRVGLLADRTTGRARRVLWVLGQAVLVAFAVVFAWEAWKSTEFTMRLNLSSDVARLPLTPFMIAMTASAAVVAAIGAWQMLRPPPPAGGAGAGRPEDEAA